MRVLYVSENPNLRSTSALLNAVIGRLRPRGLEPVMLFERPGPWQEELSREGIPCYIDSLEPPNRRKPIRSLYQISSLARLVRSNRIELIHCSVQNHYPLLRHVARWTGRPIVVTVRYKISPDFGLWAFRPPYLPDILQFTSRTQLEDCRKSFPKAINDGRIRLVMNGLDIDNFLARGDNASDRPFRPSGPRTVVIGTASVIRSHKRIEDFILLISRLRARGLAVTGLIAGGGRFGEQSYWDRLRGLIDREGLGENCTMLGNLDPVAPFMKAIDLYVSTSAYESFGMSVCEAQACGKPVIGYDAGAVRELMPEPWGLVPLGDLDALTEQAAMLATDAGLRRRLGEAGRDFVRAHFDAPVLAEAQAAIYEEILGRPITRGPTRLQHTVATPT